MKFTKYLLFALAAMVMVACSNDSEREINGGEKALLTINLKGASASKTNTRANGTPIPGVGAENDVKVVEFYVFDATGARDAYFTKTFTGTSETMTFVVTEGAGMQILVAINQSLGELGTDNYAAVKAKLTSYTLDNAKSQSIPEMATDAGFAMAGEAIKNIVAGVPNTLTMTVERLVSKVEAPTVKVGGADVTAIVADDAFIKEIFGEAVVPATVTNLKWDFNAYTVINGINASFSFFNETWNAIGWTPARAHFKTIYDVAGKITAVYSGTTGAADGFLPAAYISPVYVYENTPTKNTPTGNEGTTFAIDEVTSFLIQGTFTADVSGTPTSVIRYWRVNLIKDDVWEVFRNSVYRVTMNNITTPGYKTPEEAETKEPVIDPTETAITIDLVVSPWGLKEQSVDL